MAQKTIFELDLVRIARWQRRCAWLALLVILGIVGIFLTSMNSIAIPEIVSMGIGVMYLILMVVAVVFVGILQRVCGSSIFEAVIYGFLTIWLSFLMVLISTSRAGMILRLAGAKSGFLGVGKDQWDKLRPGHCRGCGYSREGLELLQECPECQRVPQVI